ncbi:MAG: hypothetical protein R3F55_16730 [Alphaproteobacteria bacterium]
MRLATVSRTASAIGRLVASPSASPRVEAVRKAEPVHERKEFRFRRRLPDNQPDEPTERGTYLNVVV